jgi:hypothetical protein
VCVLEQVYCDIFAQSKICGVREAAVASERPTKAVEPQKKIVWVMTSRRVGREGFAAWEL